MLIWLVAVVGIGILVFALARHNPGTVEYHIREYRAACNGTKMDQLRARVAGFFGKYYYIRPDYARRDKHLKALLRLGYLEARVFPLTWQTPQAVIPHLYVDAGSAGVDREFLTYGPVSNGIRIITLPSDMPAWRQLLLRIDKPHL